MDLQNFKKTFGISAEECFNINTLNTERVLITRWYRVPFEDSYLKINDFETLEFQNNTVSKPKMEEIIPDPFRTAILAVWNTVETVKFPEGNNEENYKSDKI